MSEAALIPMTDLRLHELEVAERHEHSNWTSTPLGKAVVSATLFAEVTPMNEAVRLPLAVAAYKIGGPELAGLVTGVSTLAIETAGGVVAADAIDTPGGRKKIARVNNWLEEHGLSKFLKTNIASEAIIANVGGTAVVTAVKHRQNPERTRDENRRYAMKSAAGLGALYTVDGYLIANSFEHPSPLTISLGAVATAVTFAGAHWAYNRIRSGGAAAESDMSKVTEADRHHKEIAYQGPRHKKQKYTSRHKKQSRVQREETDK